MRPGLLYAAVFALLGAPSARAEIHFLAKQYTRCAACHVSASGGTLLTAYGRSLSKEELSTFGKSAPDKPSTSRTHLSLFGLFSGEGPLDIGVSVRPSRLDFEVRDFKSHRNLVMRADAQVALRSGPLTAYAEVGRLPTEPAEVISREHWIRYEDEHGMGLKLGRFLQAYGLRSVDHTSLHRRDLGFDQDGQIYGIELTDTKDKRLAQFSIGARAKGLWNDKLPGQFTMSGRVQFDLSERKALVLSGLHRGSTRGQAQQFIGGVAFGFAPSSRVSLWTELDVRAMEGWKGTPEYVIMHEASFEVLRGVWLKVSPQLHTALANISGGTTRLQIGLQLLPISHVNLNFAWSADKDRESGTVFHTFVSQFHLYL